MHLFESTYTVISFHFADWTILNTGRILDSSSSISDSTYRVGTTARARARERSASAGRSARERDLRRLRGREICLCGASALTEREGTSPPLFSPAVAVRMFAKT